MQSIKSKARKLFEKIVFGGKLREKLIASYLGAIYKSQFRREWIYADHEPHFFNHRWDVHELMYGSTKNPYVFFRGFFAVESLRKGDKLLDIGCGDGFFTNAFYGSSCSTIDAVDIEESAIKTAKELNNNKNINYLVLDATSEPFPSKSYDAIIFDGAIGHFAEADMAKLIEKISNSLAKNGIFIGSESLGDHEGDDHLQYFANEEELARVFKPFFKYVFIKKVLYTLNSGTERAEAFWRCSNEDERINSLKWKQL